MLLADCEVLRRAVDQPGDLVVRCIDLDDDAIVTKFPHDARQGMLSIRAQNGKVGRDVFGTVFFQESDGFLVVHAYGNLHRSVLSAGRRWGCQQQEGEAEEVLHRGWFCSCGSRMLLVFFVPISVPKPALGK